MVYFMLKMKIEDRLKEKGWKRKEITDASRMLKRGELKQTKFQKFLTHFSFLTALIVFLIGNFFGSIILIPVFLLTTGWNLIFFLLLFGLCFGVLFELVIVTFEDKKHHTIIAGLIVPVFVLLNIYYITLLSNTISKGIFNSEGNHDSLSSALIYTAVLLIPYLSHELIKMFK